MATDMKRVFRQLLTLLVIVVLPVGVGYFVKKQTRKRREAGYQSTLYSYSRVLKPSMTRKEVGDYLRAKRLEFRQMCCVDTKEFRKIPWGDSVKIGEQDAPWYCSSTDGYLAFQFTNGAQFKEGDVASR